MGPYTKCAMKKSQRWQRRCVQLAVVSGQRILGDWELLFQYRPPPLHADKENVIQNSPLSILNNTQRLVEDMQDQVLDLDLRYSQTRSLCIRWKKLH